MVVAFLALIVFGPNKLPEIARTVGRTLSELRRQAEDLKSEFKDGMSLDDDEESEGTAADPIDKPKDKPGETAETEAAGETPTTTEAPTMETPGTTESAKPPEDD